MLNLHLAKGTIVSQAGVFHLSLEFSNDDLQRVSPLHKRECSDFSKENSVIRVRFSLFKV